MTQHKDVPQRPGIADDPSRRREQDTFRNERSPAELEAEEADDGAPDDILPSRQPPGWTSRNT